MGLFDYLKKRKSSTTGPEKKGTSKGTTAVFKGDLARVQDVRRERTSAVAVVPGNSVQMACPDNKDSEDSVVFLSFYQMKHVAWYCPECGTACGDLYDGCPVCGYKC